MSELIAKIDTGQDHEAISAIFSEFKLKLSAYISKIDAFRKQVRRVTESYEPGKGTPAIDYLTLVDALRIHDLTDSWHKLSRTKEEIYRPRDSFVQVINDLFRQKNLTISTENEPRFTTADGSDLPLMSLSSGEKQMFILLGETLLQRNRVYIFMADEPELSLHIDWQLSLVPNLRKLNPNAQIIFATHSPDIVGAYSDEALDLEKY